MGAAAFWIALGAVLIAGGWFRTRKLALRHETLRLIVEKTGTVDEAQLRELLNPTPPPLPPHWFAPPRRPEGYRVLRVFGTITMFGGLGTALFSAILTLGGARIEAPAAFGIAALITSIGAGLFFASRFVRPPQEVECREP
jgi:hypothetical protein